MAIRDVSGGKGGAAPTTGSAGGIPTPLQDGLQQAGLLEGRTPKQAAEGLLTGLRARGFSPPASAQLPFQVQAALKQFQQKNGLPQTGKLDAATIARLRDTGVIEKPAEQAAGADKPGQDGFERGATLLGKGAERRAELAKAGSPDTNFLDALINQLGPGGTAEGAPKAAGKDASAADAAQGAKAQEVKKGEGVQKKGTAAESKKDSADATHQQLDKAQASQLRVARGLKADSTLTEDQRRKDALAGKDPRELGILDEEADEEAVEGRGDEGKKRGHGGDQEGGGAEDGSSAGADGAEAEDGSESSNTNASSGDDDEADTRRGHAQLDDGSGDGAGHYRVPQVAEQCVQALDKIVRDKAEENRATTYSWDVTFFKPGVYGPGQKAQELVHLVVTKATAFDPVWQKAQANLQALVRRVDGSGADAPLLDDIIHALRQARARDGDDTATKLQKVTRPIGRA